jgi:hypothetical protein
MLRIFSESTRLESEDDITVLLAVVGDRPIPQPQDRLLEYQECAPEEREIILRDLNSEVYIPGSALVRAFWIEEDRQRQRLLVELIPQHGKELPRDEWLALLDRCAAERRRLLPLMSDAARGWITRQA